MKAIYESPIFNIIVMSEDIVTSSFAGTHEGDNDLTWGKGNWKGNEGD